MHKQIWNIRVNSKKKDEAIAYAAGSDFTIGRPLHFDDSNSSPSALEYFLSAIGGDVLGCFRMLADKQRVVLDALEASVQVELINPLVYLGVIGEEGTPGIKKLSLKVFASSNVEPSCLQSIWEQALKRSPLANSFLNLFEFDISFKQIS